MSHFSSEIGSRVLQPATWKLEEDRFCEFVLCYLGYTWVFLDFGFFLRECCSLWFVKVLNFAHMI